MVRADASESKGGGLLEAGGHHLMVEACEEKTGEFGSQVVAEVVCLASTDPTQIGRKKMFFLEYTGERAWQWFEFAIAVGLISQADYDRSKKSGEVIDIDETKAVGRQLCVEMREEKWIAKSGKHAGQERRDFQYGHRIWAVDAPQASAVPKEEKAFGAFMKAKERAMAAKGQQLAGSAPAGGAPAAGHGAANGGSNGGGANGGEAQQPAAAAAAASGGGEDDEDWGQY